jgi:hypothetical protein
MKKSNPRKKTGKKQIFSGLKLNPQEIKTLQSAVKLLDEQAERLGLLDPLDAEPAMIFFAEEEQR